MALLLNKALLKCQISRKLVNYYNCYVYLLTFKRNYLSSTKLRENTQYEYNSNELAKWLKQFQLVGSSPINQDNMLNYLSNYLKENDFQTKDDILRTINVINYAFKSNQTIEILNKDPNLNRFLAQVESHTGDMTFEELVSALIACGSLKIPLSSSVSRRLTTAVGRKMKESTLLPLLSLTNLAIFSKRNSDQMYPYSYMNMGTSHILAHLNECQSIYELYLITIYIGEMRKVFPIEALKMHVSKMGNLLLEVDPQQNLKELLRILVFYKHRSWTNLDGKIIKNMLKLIADAIPNMTNEELQAVANFQDVVRESVSIVHRILEEADSRHDKNSDIHLLYCRAASHLPDDVAKISADIFNYMKNYNSTDLKSNRILVEILKHKSHLNLRKVHQIYWEKVVEDISSKILTHHEASVLLSSHSAHYWRAKRVYRVDNCAEYETHFHDLAMLDIKHGTASLQPQHLARLAPSILNYASNEDNFDVIPKIFVESIEKMSPQFGLKDVHSVAVGIDSFNRKQIRTITNRRASLKGNDYLNRISNAMNDSIERLMTDKKLDIESMSVLIRASTARGALERNRTQDRLIRCIEEECSNPSSEIVISSRIIQNVTRNLKRMHYAVPHLCGKMLMYVNENKNDVSADTAGRLLYYLFSVGYEPDRELVLPSGNKNAPKILNSEIINFENFVHIIHRDFNLIPAWLIISSCLALGFYQALPLNLINRVFNFEFITRVEKETLNNCEGANQPQNILNLMMRLNRIVCLDFPEASIPWFKQNFFEANRMHPFDMERNVYFNEIYNLLLKFVGGDKSMIRLNHITPYGYRVPFVIYFNTRKQLISPPLDEGPQILNKVAIIPLGAAAYCANEELRLRGSVLLQERHLGILGYEVIQICYREWNAMCMNLPGARENLLRKCLRKYHLLIE